MKKEQVRIEDLILVSSILFDRFDSMDVSVLKQMISNDFELVVDDVSDNYFIINDGTVIVEESYFSKINIFDMNLKKDVKKSNLYKYLKHINIVEFILRKIKLLDNGSLPVSELEQYLFSHQIELLKKIYKEDYVTVYNYVDTDYNENFLALKLTKRGDLYLYLIDNKEKIDKFFGMLEELGCNYDVFNVFLLSQDLEKNVDEILTVNNFMNFCYERGVNLLSIEDKNSLKRVKK